MKYVVSQRALETIEWECRKYPDLETGGILVGFKDRDQVYITHDSGSGPNADRSSHHFTKDTPYLQSVLQLLGNYYQVDYLGVWHKHPNEMPFPSAGDVVSAMTEVSDQEIGLDELITPICVIERGKVGVRTPRAASIGILRIQVVVQHSRRAETAGARTGGV